MRVHETDGSSYDHVIEIREAFARLEIPYHTKRKRGGRRNASYTKVVPSGDTYDDQYDGDAEFVLHGLGDVLQSEADMRNWQLVDWSKEDEERMQSEGFEWLRVDADGEWICEMSMNQPDYMYVSQLQQDPDVIAQYEVSGPTIKCGKLTH